MEAVVISSEREFLHSLSETLVHTKRSMGPSEAVL
jgi:hypothetical protein